MKSSLFYLTEDLRSDSDTCNLTLAIDLSGSKDLPKYFTHPIDLPPLKYSMYSHIPPNALQPPPPMVSEVMSVTVD